MRTWLIGIAVVAVCAALGVGAAYGGNAALQAYRAQRTEAVQTVRESNPQRWDIKKPAQYRPFNGSRQGSHNRTDVSRSDRSGNSNPKP
jgi:hypothetical protein